MTLRHARLCSTHCPDQAGVGTWPAERGWLLQGGSTGQQTQQEAGTHMQR